MPAAELFLSMYEICEGYILCERAHTGTVAVIYLSGAKLNPYSG